MSRAAPPRSSVHAPLHRVARRRALIVNCYADETRRSVARACKVPQTLGPVFLAGAFQPEHWDIRLHNEVSHGPLEDEAVLGRPDLLVLTGLVTSLDRMRHLTAYARSKNPAVVVAAGGHVVRAFPRYCATFLDYACQGDVEELAEVVADAFGPGYASDAWRWRFDLCDWIGRVGYAESSRYCNFACSFCTLAGEGRAYRAYDPPAIRAQVEAAGRKRYLVFLDNNFYGNDRDSFRRRIAMAGTLRGEGHYPEWSALVTSDFFLEPDNLRLARESGCSALFTGVESFSREWVVRHNKRQNATRPQIEVIRECLEAGIVFLYGLILDLTSRTIVDVKEELDAIFDCPDITLPAYVSLPIPIPGTPYFHECRERDLILPSTKVRDLDATTISLRPRDSLEDATRFVGELQSMAGYQRRILRHSVSFWRRHRDSLTKSQMAIALANGALIVAPLLATGPRPLAPRGTHRTFVSTTEAPDDVYTPAFRVDRRFEHYFEPAMLTEATGEFSAALAEDLLASRPDVGSRRRARTLVAAPEA